VEPIMLVGKMVRVRYARDRIIANYLDMRDPGWRETAEQLLDLFRAQVGGTRGELEDELRERFGDDPSQLVHQGLAKLLEDRCEFEVDASLPPEQIRASVFRLAAQERQSSHQAEVFTFNRQAVLERAAKELAITADQVDQGLFADLKSQQRLIHFQDLTSDRLLQRYNVALAQAILLRATGVHVTVRGEPPQRYRQLLRQVKFHRLVCEAEKLGQDSFALHLDGPLSLFSATHKYGLQLALFLPAVLLCRDFDLRAELRWGSQKKPRYFLLGPRDGLVSHLADTGMYVPPELNMFARLFAERVTDWELSEETEIYPLGTGFWVPDFRLRHRPTGKTVLLEVLGFWRRSSAEKHLQRLRQHVTEPFLLAVSDQLHIDEAELDNLPAGIHRFRHMPLPDEIGRLASSLLA
jgi:predicted nuclease of restriction endonuclease-like RecB superfamily